MIDFVRAVSVETGWSMRKSRDWVRRVIRTESKGGSYDKTSEDYRITLSVLRQYEHPRLGENE